MNYEPRTKIFSFLFIIIFVAIDQISKYIIRHGGGFYICNSNIALGIKIPPFFFWLFGIGIITAIFSVLSKFLGNTQRETRLASRRARNKQIQNPVYILPLVLILAGALSNMADRLTLGCVTDFIDWKIWPAFNLADAFIVSGALFWLARLKKIK